VSGAHIALLLGAGLVAGMAGSSGAITSLISYPALLAIGIPPLTANVTNSIALVASWPGSAAGSRPELRGQGPWLLRWAPAAAAGGLAGAALLLWTPPGAFNHVVPFLVALAAVTLLLQPRLTTWRANRTRRFDHLALPVGLSLVSVYDGYFGAGSGIMVLVLLMVTLGETLPRANALKNMTLGVTDFVAAIAFALFGHVRWAAAAYLAIGVLVGSRIGPSITRRAPSGVVRVVVALAGFGLAIQLWVHPS
jgi:hypothetical protein